MYVVTLSSTAQIRDQMDVSFFSFSFIHLHILHSGTWLPRNRHIQRRRKKSLRIQNIHTNLIINIIHNFEEKKLIATNTIFVLIMYIVHIIISILGGHLINTNCSMGHLRKALCCKMSVEFDTFLESGKK